MVSKLDNLSQYIQDKLIQNGLDKTVNVIHLSDHGMSSVTPPNFINLMDFVANDSCKMFGSSPVVQIVPSNAGACIIMFFLKFLANFYLIINFRPRE